MLEYHKFNTIVGNPGEKFSRNRMQSRDERWRIGNCEAS